VNCAPSQGLFDGCVWLIGLSRIGAQKRKFPMTKPDHEFEIKSVIPAIHRGEIAQSPDKLLILFDK
jgi:hypothetical protein